MARDDSDEQINLMSTRVADLLGKAPVVAAPMKPFERRRENARPRGILHPRDRRRQTCGYRHRQGFTQSRHRGRCRYGQSRIIGHDAGPLRLDADNTALDALLAMTREKIRHLPILSGSRVAGSSPIPIFCIGKRPPRLFGPPNLQWFDQSGTRGMRRQYSGDAFEFDRCRRDADNVGRIVTSISDAATARLLQLGEENSAAGTLPVDGGRSRRVGANRSIGPGQLRDHRQRL